MRKFIVLFAVAVAAIIPTQAGAHHTPAHTQSQLNQTRAQLAALRTFVHNCLAWHAVGIGIYGAVEPDASEGYEYRFEGNTELTTALDIVPGPHRPTFWLAEVRPGCIRQVGPRSFSAAAVRSASLARKAFRVG